MLCPKCGSEISENAKFCTKCGNKVEQPVVVAPQQSNLSGHNISAIWPEWQIEGKPLGKGSFGVVYKAVRRDHNVESYAAIKVISIPADPSEVDSLRSEGLDMNATRTYLKGIVNDFVSEIQLMESLKGVQNIVSVEDYKVVEKAGEIGWDIYIRMELLTPFNTHICDKKLTEEEVIKLGCDICTALEICAKRNIIHRDIKPENIFINDFGYFKLGDFGIARKMENMTGGLSQKGSPNYMAPEVTNGSEYDSRVDTYSLGIVLYRLLNGNRLPFLDSEKQLLNPNERRLALDRRLRGEDLPAPCDASPAMADLILRACAYDPDMRFSSATEMKQALMSIANGTYQMAVSNLDRTTSVRRAPANYDKTTSVRKALADSNQKSTPTVDTFGSTPKKKSKTPAVIATVLAVVLLVGAGIFGIPKLIGNNDSEDANTSGNNSSESGNYSKFDEEQIATIISEADVLAAEDDYEGALVKIQTGLVTYPKSADLKNKADEYTESLNAQIKEKTLAEANSLADSGDYVSAITLIKNAQETYGDDADYQAALKTYSTAYRTEVIASADSLAANGDYIGALNTINSATDIIGTNEDFDTKMVEYEDSYVNESLASADELLNIRDIDGAKQIIEDALDIFPDNTDLIAKSKDIESMKPVSLATIAPFNFGSKYIKNIVWNEGTPADPFGNDYTSCKNYSINKFDPDWLTGNAYAEYNLDGKYDRITGRLSPYSDIEENGSIYMQIFADGQLAYTSPIITRKTELFEFSVDITGAKYIKIFVQIQNSGGSLIMSDVMLWKESVNGTTPDADQPCVLISTLSPFNSGSKYIDDIVWNVGFPADIPGNDYTYCKNYSINRFDPGWLTGNAYVEYRLNGEYNRITGKISPYIDIEENGSIYVQVLADEQLVYTSPDITRKTEMFEFSVDISNATYIKIIVQIKNSGGSLIMSDVALWTD